MSTKGYHLSFSSQLYRRVLAALDVLQAWGSTLCALIAGVLITGPALLLFTSSPPGVFTVILLGLCAVVFAHLSAQLSLRPLTVLQLVTKIIGLQIWLGLTVLAYWAAGVFLFGTDPIIPPQEHWPAIALLFAAMQILLRLNRPS